VGRLYVKRTVVRTTFPYPLKWDKGNLDVRIGDKVFDVHFERQYRQDTDPQVSGSGIISTRNLEVERDRLGRAAHTSVEIHFPMCVEHDLGNNDELLKWVHAVINRLLDVYRYTAEEFHVCPIPKKELGMYTVRTINASGTLDRESMVSGGVTNWLVHAPPQPIPDEARQFLRSGTELSFPEVFLLNAKREELFENYRIAVVEAETAFEILVRRVVAQHFRQQGRSTTKIDQIAFQNLIQHHIPRCCGEPFEGTPEHAAWKSDLYDLRNSVVHDGASVEPNQAGQALDAAERAIKWIEVRASV
jgi:hypothetical protein